MSDVSQILIDMQACGLPSPPNGILATDGKLHKYGKGKKAWYSLREIDLRSGRRVIVGSFGLYQGQDSGKVKVSADAAGLAPEDIAEYHRKQKETAAQEAEDRRNKARLAANRARDQWNKAANVPVLHPYLERKQIEPEGVRVSADGLLLIPAMRDGQMVAVQKVDAAGVKKFNYDSDTIGAGHTLGVLAGAPVIGVGEGYATSRTIHMLAPAGFPVEAAFTAGNIMAVALRLRAAHPDAHLVFFADDDYLLQERFVRDLADDFGVSTPVAIDGQTHMVRSDDGQIVEVMAHWMKDAQGVDYIAADVRRARGTVRTPKFSNAGVSSCRAAAAAVGNASVVLPVFRDRGGRKISDFNDLAIEESFEVAAAQIGVAILAAQQPGSALSVHPAAPAAVSDAAYVARADDSVEADSLAPPAAQQPGFASPAVDAAPAVFLDMAVLFAEGVAEASPAPLVAQGGADEAPAVPASIDVLAEAHAHSPPPLETTAAPGTTGAFTLEWAVSHCALVQGSTDIWDSLNKLRMKKAAFVDMVGKEVAKGWASAPVRRTISPRALPKTVRGVASQDGVAGGDNIVMMLDRYTLLYGTKTVFDADKKSIIAYDAMALARGNDLATRWLAHPLHMEKDYDKVVFDPTQRVDLNTHINLFEGFPLTPRPNEAKAQLVLELLWSLCATEANGADVFRWVLCWLAYPLQHPGAKMQTGLLFFGEKQGTGKSLFFEGIVKPIYGAHGATGGQHQLEGAYTMWRSQKLFVLFEEILSRQDKYSYFGLIKHMITGRDTPISQKFKDDRVEANHMNCVMLSNEFQAIPLEPEDRRFLVVDVRQPLAGELLARLTAELEDGLVEAFYAFLLAYPLGDFTPHTKPLMTPSKERVINFGRPDWEAFYLAWRNDELAAPYCTCLSTDLYNVFSRYSSKYGLRSMSMTKFNELIGQRLKKNRQWVNFTTTGKGKLLSVFHVPYVPADGDQPEVGREGSISEQCKVFRDLADVRTEPGC